MKFPALSKPALTKLHRSDLLGFFSLPGSYWHYRADCDSTPQQPSHYRAFLHLSLRSYLPSCPWCKYCLRKLSLPIFLWSRTVSIFLKFQHTDMKWWFYGNWVYIIDNGMNLNIAKALLLQCLHLVIHIHFSSFPL